MMENHPAPHPIAFPRVEVTDGRVRLCWLRNHSFAKASSDPEAEYARFRIWRKRATVDDHYVHCCTPVGFDGAECLFDGSLDHSETGYEWTDTPPHPDTSVEYHAYFIASASSAPLELLPIAVRHRELWWTYDFLRGRLAGIHARHPAATRLDVVGHTASGREIPRLIAGTGRPAVALIGLIHAGESGPELMVPIVEGLLDKEPDLLERVRVIIIPAVNIDQREKMVRGHPYYLRTNAVGTDINRNFPAAWDTVSSAHGTSNTDPRSPTYRGPAPASAPETRAVMTGLNDPDLRVVLSGHWGNSLCAFPALSCAMCEGDAEYVAASRKVVESYAAGLYPEREYEEWFHGLQTSPGSLPAWCYCEKRIPGFDLEGGSIQLGYGTDDRSPFTPAMLADYRERHFRGLRNVLRNLGQAIF